MATADSSKSVKPFCFGLGNHQSIGWLEDLYVWLGYRWPDDRKQYKTNPSFRSLLLQSTKAGDMVLSHRHAKGVDGDSLVVYCAGCSTAAEVNVDMKLHWEDTPEHGDKSGVSGYNASQETDVA